MFETLLISIADLPSELFVAAAFALQASGFLIRDELWLRLLILCGTLFYLAYYFLVPEGPMWAAIGASGVLALINIVLIGVIVHERTLWTMSAQDAMLYESLGTLTPGQFRKIMRVSQTRIADARLVIATEGAALDRLYFISHGPIEIEKSGTRFPIDDRCFIGEIAFLLQQPASATVWLERGATYREWRSDDLRNAMRKSPSLHTALTSRFGAELARKLSISYPGIVRPSSGWTDIAHP